MNRHKEKIRNFNRLKKKKQYKRLRDNNKKNKSKEKKIKNF